jgi:hypothetical protein
VIPTGNGAGHAAPTTPAALVNVIAVSFTVPVIAALPLQTVPFVTPPAKVTCPSSVDPFSVAVTCPLQLTDVDVQVPRTSEPDCVRRSVTCSVELFDDAIVPPQVPATFAVVPADTELGAVDVPAHAAQPTVTARITAKRIFVPSIDVQAILLCASFAPWRRWERLRMDMQHTAAQPSAGVTILSRITQAALQTVFLFGARRL